MTAADHVMVSADSQLDGSESIRKARREVCSFVKSISGSKVTIKIGPSLVLCGHELVDAIREYADTICFDLKLFDIEETLRTYGRLLSVMKPNYITVLGAAGTPALKALRRALPKEIKLLAVTVPTSWTDEQCEASFGCKVRAGVRRFAKSACEANLEGAVAAAAEIRMLRRTYGSSLSINCPGTRSKGVTIPGDDQNLRRSKTPPQAIDAGATTVILGREVSLAPKPIDVLNRILQEIEELFPF